VLHWWDAAAVGLHSTPLRAVIAHPKGFICGGDSGRIVTFRRNPKTAEYSLCRQLQPCAGADILELQLCGASHAGDSAANFNHLNRILVANGRGELGHLDGAACFPSSSAATADSSMSSSSSGALADTSAVGASSSARALSFGAALDAFQADLAATTAATLADTSGAATAGAAVDTGSVAGTVATASTGAAATAAAATANSSTAAAIRTALYTPCVTGLWTSATADLTTSSSSAYSDHTTAGGAVSVTRQPRTVDCRLAQATGKPLLAVLNAPAEALDPAELLIWDYRCREVSSYKASFVCAEQSVQFCSEFLA
jgi:hypothetical protein